MNNENEMQARRERDARSPVTSPLRTRSAQNMFAPAPAPVPVHQPIRRVVTSPPVYHSPPVYGPDPNLIYGAPAPVYGAPLPYIPQYAHNASLYYPPPVAQPQVIIRQAPMAPAYGAYDPNFQAYFGADVVPQSAQSPIDQQREQYEILSRNRAPRSESSYNSRSQSSIQATLDAEAREMEEAIQLSLTESSRRAARPQTTSVTSEYTSGYTTRTNSTRSALSAISVTDLRPDWDVDSIAPSNANMTPEELADEKALQAAIMESIREAEREQERILSPRSQARVITESAVRYEAPRSFVKPTPPVPVDRQYPYNLDENVRRLTSPERSRPVRTESAYQSSSYERSASAQRLRHLQQERYNEPASSITDESEFEYYPEARATVHTTHTSRTTTQQSNYRLSSPTSAGYSGYDRHTSPRNAYEEETRGRQLTRRTSSGRDFYEQQDRQIGRRTSSGRDFVEEEPRQLNRRTSSGRDFVEEEPRQLNRRTSSGRDFYEQEAPPRMLAGRTSSGRDFVDHEVRGRVVRRTPSGRDFLESDYHPNDPRRNIGSSPEVAAKLAELVSEKSITQHRSSSASRERTNIRTDFEDSDYSREYSEGRNRRLLGASPTHARVSSSQVSGSGISAAEAAESRYGRTADFPKFALMQTRKGYESPATASESDLSSHEDLLEKLPLPARPLPPPPVFRHATLRAPTPPPPVERMVSGTKFQ